MKYTFYSRKLKREITFSIPGASYIFVDLNGNPGVLGDQICSSGNLTGNTISYHGNDYHGFCHICERWWSAYLRNNKDYL